MITFKVNVPDIPGKYYQNVNCACTTEKCCIILLPQRTSTILIYTAVQKMVYNFSSSQTINLSCLHYFYTAEDLAIMYCLYNLYFSVARHIVQLCYTSLGRIALLCGLYQEVQRYSVIFFVAPSTNYCDNIQGQWFNINIQGQYSW